MSKWISQGVFGDPIPPIEITEIHSSHNESHNIISGNPVFKARLAVKWADYSRAISEILGKPQKWPHETVFDSVNSVASVRAVAIELVNDSGDAYVDAEKEALNYKFYAIFDVTYIPRKGVYIAEDFNHQAVYWEDELQQRYESLPMDHTKLVWGNVTDTAPTVIEQLHANEAPVKFETGQTLVHTIEGWCREIPDTGPVVGTTNQDEYISGILKRTFAADTLLLRSLNVTQSFSFRSYRAINPTAPIPPDYEMSGKPTNTLRLHYEYRKEGWQKFWRNNIDAALSGYYYIRQNKAPYDKVIPFPIADHATYLGL